MRKTNKRGISVIVGYVLLIVIAITISLMVYAWLKDYIPKNQEECPDDVSIVIKEYNCDLTAGKMNISFLNKGKFNISGVYLRYSDNPDKLPIEPIVPFEVNGKNVNNNWIKAEEGRLVFHEGVKRKELGPKETYNISFNFVGEIKSISIKPFKMFNGKINICEGGSIKEEINCV